MLQRVSIQNFKSLKDVTLDLQKVNLLIGPNNSGKTNFLKAITAMGRESEINQRSFRTGSSEITFEVIYRFEETSKFLKTLPSWDIKYMKKYPISTNELMRVLDFTVHPVIMLIDKVTGNIIESPKETPFLEDLYQYFQVPIYKINPDNIVSSSEYRSDPILNGDGSNALQLLQYLDSRLPFVFENLENDFRRITQEFTRIRRPDTKPGMFELLLIDKLGAGYRKDDLSEGILYFLALLCIVYQPNPPKLLLLEEPERGIHPRRIGEVMNFIFRLAEEKDIQIILTTHNEHVLDDFTTRPEAVFVFDKNEEGATEVRNLKKDIIDPSHKKSREHGLDGIDFTTNLSDNWLYGLLGGVPENI